MIGDVLKTYPYGKRMRSKEYRENGRIFNECLAQICFTGQGITELSIVRIMFKTRFAKYLREKDVHGIISRLLKKKYIEKVEENLAGTIQGNKYLQDNGVYY